MEGRFSRTALLLGPEAVSRLSLARVLIFGLGGVGGAAMEAICRAGVGSIDVVDSDTVSRTNINRQIIALESTVDMKKTEAAKNRMKDINPYVNVRTYESFVSHESISEFDFAEYDYVLDAIDTISAKIIIIEKCVETGTPVISSMGTGNKLSPELLRIGDIYETRVCPLARVMRRELRKRGVRSLQVIWSPEEPKTPVEAEYEKQGKGPVPGTVSFVPPVAGYLMASAVVRKIAGV